jgi:thiosulfate reductase cytochrome b subunit
LNFQHFLNAFFIILIARTGWLVRTTQRPAAYWTRNNRGLIRTKGEPKKISLDLWLHQSLDVLWVTNGLIFVVLLFITGQWMRIVPTSWDVFPNAVSSAIQYASLNWPLENGWTNYNSLQVLAYFTIVFIAAPLAIITGLRMSNLWPGPSARISKIYPLPLARAVHLPVMIFFVLFIIVHVTLVLTTGALKNLNHMFAANNGDSWLGFGIFALLIALIVAAWILAKPAFLQPLASLGGKVTRQ